MEKGSLLAPVGRLLAAIDEVKSILDSPINDATAVGLGGLAMDEAIHAVERVRNLGLETVPPELVWPITHDAELLAQTFRVENEPADAHIRLARLLRDRIVQGCAHLALTMKPDVSDEALVNDDDRALAESRRILESLAGSYREDARVERRTMLALYAVVLILMVAAGAVALLGIPASRHRPHANNTVDFSVFAMYAAVAVAAVGAAALLLRESRRHRLASQEANRLQRQLAALDAYVLPMGPAMRDLIRGALVQRIFPGLPTVEEPWQAPTWPDSEALLGATYANHGFDVRED
jgi:hypothetical protein